MSKKSKWNQETVVRGALRRAFSRSPIVREVLQKSRREVPKYNKDGSRAKKDAVQYLCNVCGEWVSSTKVAVDHITPVVSVDEGFVDVQTFHDRLFCDISNLQCICDSCHREKTNAERLARQRKKDLIALEAIYEDLSTYTRKELNNALKRFRTSTKHPDVVARAVEILSLLK